MMNYCRYCGIKLKLTNISYTYQTESCVNCGMVLRNLDVQRLGNGYLIETNT